MPSISQTTTKADLPHTQSRQISSSSNESIKSKVSPRQSIVLGPDRRRRPLISVGGLPSFEAKRSGIACRRFDHALEDGIGTGDAGTVFRVGLTETG